MSLSSFNDQVFYQQNRETFQYLETYTQSIIQLFNLFNKNLFNESCCAVESPRLYAINIEENHIEKICVHSRTPGHTTKYANLILKEEFEHKDLVNRFTGKRKTVYQLSSLATIINTISCADKKQLTESALIDLNKRITNEKNKKNWLQNFLYY